MNDENPSEPQTLTLDITERQARMIQEAERAEREARERKHLVIRTVVASHDIPDGTSVQSIDGRTITVQLPE